MGSECFGLWDKRSFSFFWDIFSWSKLFCFVTKHLFHCNEIQPTNRSTTMLKSWKKPWWYSKKRNIFFNSFQFNSNGMHQKKKQSHESRNRKFFPPLFYFVELKMFFTLRISYSIIITGDDDEILKAKFHFISFFLL